MNRTPAIVALMLGICMHVFAAQHRSQPIEPSLPYRVVDTGQDAAHLTISLTTEVC